MSHTSHIGQELTEILSSSITTSGLIHSSELPPHPASYAPWPDWVNPELRQYLELEGIDRLYDHQARMAQNAMNGVDTVISTGTSSGKSLGYQLPILSYLASAQDSSSVLYLSPTKALAQDQRASISRLARAVPALSDLIVATYDGDTPADARRALRDHAQFIITNPDMIHYSILAQPEKWGRMLRTVKYIVIDECHTYRGVFGAHVSLVLRRFLRLARAHGAEPTLLLASATVADPTDLAQRLTGREGISAITEDGSPQGARTIDLWEPHYIPESVSAGGTPLRRNANAEAAHMMGMQIEQGARTLTFVRSRQGAERVALQCKEFLADNQHSDLASRIGTYRAGYTAQDRRAIEQALDNGELLGVASTNALELGIDVGGLDAVICCGFPGTIASFWQQAGRAGRRGQGSLVSLVARDEPMDSYLVHHPEALLDRSIEASVFNPHNPYILTDHIICAASELPLTQQDVEDFGAQGIVQNLVDQGILRSRSRGIFPASAEIAREAHGCVDIRGSELHELMLVDSSSGEIIGQVNADRATREVFPGARYFHQGQSFVVSELDLDNDVVLLDAEDPEWSTYATDEISIEILDTLESRHYTHGVELSFERVRVHEQVTGFLKKLPDGTIVEKGTLDYPPTQLDTTAALYTISAPTLQGLGIPASHWPGTLHAAEHMAIGMLPLLATCDRWDLGGLSTVLHEDTGEASVFVYDATAGGAGFSEYGYHYFHQWMNTSADAIESCPCEDGCPSCIQSPKCGNGNEPLYKPGAIALLRYLANPH